MTCISNVWNSRGITDRRNYGRSGRSFFVPAHECQARTLECLAPQAWARFFASLPKCVRQALGLGPAGGR